MKTAMEWIRSEYLKERKPHWTQFLQGSDKVYQTRAIDAFRSARIRREWKDAEYAGDETYNPDPEFGQVRLRVVPDDYADIADLEGDCFNPKVNPEIPVSRLEREQKEFRAKVEREGVCGIIGEYWDGEKWRFVDSCCGFVGDDWKNSGYDIDIMSQTLAESKQLRDVVNFLAPYPQTWKQPIGYMIVSGQHYKVVGFCCEEQIPRDRNIPVYFVNIGPLYSQHCARCGRELIHGTSGVELFDGKA